MRKCARRTTEYSSTLAYLSIQLHWIVFGFVLTFPTVPVRTMLKRQKRHAHILCEPSSGLHSTHPHPLGLSLSRETPVYILFKGLLIEISGNKKRSNAAVLTQ